jgi:hypothetical protein
MCCAYEKALDPKLYSSLNIKRHIYCCLQSYSYNYCQCKAIDKNLHPNINGNIQNTSQLRTTAGGLFEMNLIEISLSAMTTLLFLFYGRYCSNTND